MLLRVHATNYCTTTNLKEFIHSSSESSKVCLTPVDSTIAPSLAAFFSLLIPPFLPLPLDLPLPSLPLPSFPLPSLPLPLPSPALLALSVRPMNSSPSSFKAFSTSSAVFKQMKAMPLALPSSFKGILKDTMPSSGTPCLLICSLRASSVHSKAKPPTKISFSLPLPFPLPSLPSLPFPSLPLPLLLPSLPFPFPFGFPLPFMSSSLGSSKS
mmetsp:Transcript_113608/g.178775  ORF Transcript_113608/g.178775 Transcript_113608/m.178775 type:complete len:212 (+) Transcript_113608:134-769(+)